MMPEAEREVSLDPDEEVIWDADNNAASESDVFDLLDDGDDE